MDTWTIKNAVVPMKDDGASNARGSWCHLDLFNRLKVIETFLPANGGCRWRLSRWLAGGFPFVMAAALHRPAVLCRAKEGTCPVHSRLFYCSQCSSAFVICQERFYGNCQTFALAKATSVGLVLLSPKTP